MLARRFLIRVTILAAFIAVSGSAKPLSPAGLAGLLPGGEPVLIGPQVVVVREDVPAGPAQFDTTPAPLPPNVASLGFEASATSEFGDLVRLNGAGHYIDSVTVTLSSGAIRSDYPESAPLGFTHPITLRLYAVNRSSGVALPGATIATLTRSFLIPWRPEPDPSSTSRLWKAADGNHYAGRAFHVTFDLGTLAESLPDEIVFGISFNTEHQGNAPLGTPGPYNALHLGLTQRAPDPGMDVESDVVYWKTADSTAYTNSLAAGTLALQRDTGWMGYRPAVRFTNSTFGTLIDTAAALREVHSRDAATEQSLRDATTLISFTHFAGMWDGHNRLQPELGGTTFELLYEAVDELSIVSISGDPSVRSAREALFSLMGVAQSLAEIALGDALIGGGNAWRISRAQGWLEAANASDSREDYPRYINELWRAWREAQLALE